MIADEGYESFWKKLIFFTNMSNTASYRLLPSSFITSQTVTNHSLNKKNRLNSNYAQGMDNLRLNCAYFSRQLESSIQPSGTRPIYMLMNFRHDSKSAVKTKT